MKVELAVVIDIDPADWSAQYGCDGEDVPADVASYFRTAIQGQPAVDLTRATVSVRQQ